ncbi:MAG: copper chaperone PCu(A)C [Hyphomicrobiaceae bacterium]
MAFTGLVQAAERPALVQAAERPALAQHARIRWLPGDLPLAGYFDLTNTGPRPFTLTGASSRAFGDVMMHRTIHSGGQVGMVPLPDLQVQPGQTVHFTPDGYHLMLMNRTRALAKGDKVPISLKFSGGRAMEVMFTVRGADMQ